MLRQVRASRRALLGGSLAGAAALLTGCGELDSSSGATAPGAADPTAPAVDADSDLVADVVEEITSALALATATATSFPGLRAFARDLGDLHRAHLGELGAPTGPKRPRRPVEDDAASARAKLLRAEERLQGDLVEAAGAAGSGALAQVFASMAAAVAQRRALA